MRNSRFNVAKVAEEATNLVDRLLGGVDLYSATIARATDLQVFYRTQRFSPVRRGGGTLLPFDGDDVSLHGSWVTSVRHRIRIGAEKRPEVLPP